MKYLGSVIGLKIYDDIKNKLWNDFTLFKQLGNKTVGEIILVEIGYEINDNIQSVRNSYSSAQFYYTKWKKPNKKAREKLKQ